MPDKLNVVIDGNLTTALVDTRAGYSVFGGKLARLLRKVITPWDGPQVRTTGGHLITPVGRCTARAVIHGEICPMNFLVLQDYSKGVILRMDFLCEYNAVVYLGANRITLIKPSPRTEKPNAALAVIRVSADHVRLPPRLSLFVPVEIESVTRSEVLLKSNVELLLGREIGVARGLTKLQNGRAKLLVTNIRKETQHLTKGTAVGDVEEPLDSAAITAFSEDFFIGGQENAAFSL